MPLTQTILLVPLVWLLRLAREAWSSIGWHLPAGARRKIALGVAAGVAVETFAVARLDAVDRWLGVVQHLVRMGAHRVSNTVAFELIYLGRYPGMR